MIKENQVYDFKKEFCAELKIPMNQAERKLKELLEWLTYFYEYDFLEGRPNRIHIKAIIGEYQPLPRKLPKQDGLNAEKLQDYTEYTIKALSSEYKPNSKSKIAREAIQAFGQRKYYHTNKDAVARRYVKKPFELYGETNDKLVWVYYSTYTPLEEKVVEDWRNIMYRERISEAEAASAFYRQAEGKDVSKEIGYYNNARQIFMEKYGDFPVLVKEWKCKASQEDNQESK